MGDLSPRWCLDSWAILRLLEDSEGIAQRIDAAIEEGAVMSWVSAGEVYYVTWRASGKDVAETVIDALRTSLLLDEPSADRVLAAASIKAEHRMSHADAFACATGRAYGATLLTGDPEIVNATGPWTARDLRAI